MRDEMPQWKGGYDLTGQSKVYEHKGKGHMFINSLRIHSKPKIMSIKVVASEELNVIYGDMIRKGL